MNRNPEMELKARCPDCGAAGGEGRPWHEVDVPQEWGLLGFGARWHCDNCDGYRVITPWDVKDHMPERGSEVEAWLLRWRDSRIGTDACFQVLDDMVDEYRLRADTGTSFGKARRTRFQ